MTRGKTETSRTAEDDVFQNDERAKLSRTTWPRGGSLENIEHIGWLVLLAAFLAGHLLDEPVRLEVVDDRVRNAGDPSIQKRTRYGWVAT